MKEYSKHLQELIKREEEEGEKFRHSLERLGSIITEGRDRLT